MIKNMCGWTNGDVGCRKTFPSSADLETHRTEAQHLKTARKKIKKEDVDTPETKKKKSRDKHKHKEQHETKKKHKPTKDHSHINTNKKSTEKTQDIQSSKKSVPNDNKKKRKRPEQTVEDEKKPEAKKPRKSLLNNTPDRIEVFLDLNNGFTPGWWCGTVARQDNDDPDKWLVKFDDGDKLWINSKQDMFRPCGHGWNRTKIEKQVVVVDQTRVVVNLDEIIY